MVDKRDYGPKRGGGPVMVNIRLSPSDGHSATKRELGDVLDSIIDRGVVPRGWKFAGIEWQNPKRASSGWRRGELDDLDKFRPVLAEIGKTKLLEHFRAAEVAGKGVPLTRKQQQAFNKARLEMGAAHKARAKALQERDKRKTVEARRKWEDKAEFFRKRYANAAGRADKLSARAFGGREYELAASYSKGRRGR